MRITPEPRLAQARFEGEVRNGVSTRFRLVEAENYEGDNVDQVQQEYGTVELLFDAAAKRIENSGVAAAVSYNDTSGYPREIGTRTDSEARPNYNARFVVDSLITTE